MRAVSLCLALLLAACAAARFDRVGEPEAQYAAEHPFYAEFCALSQIKKKPGYGADIRGEIGGHSVFYLEGACRVPGESYPVLQVCDGEGVGLSVNSHFRNAKWVAIPGHDFFFQGDLQGGAPLTRAGYQSVQQEAKRLGLYDAIQFNDWVFDGMPPGWSREDWKYEMSIATDYGIALGRGRNCARVPVDRAGMQAMVDFLNAQNAPYRAGADFHWDVFRDNCIHLAHNALARVGLWPVWPTGRSYLVSVFDFPVPRNEFVNLMRRTNDDPPDPGAVYWDLAARESLLAHGVLPWREGALAESRPPMRPNEVYDTDLAMIFYDDPVLGSYQSWNDQIFADPRYTDPAANQAYVAAAARQAETVKKPLDWWLAREPYRSDKPGFTLIYDRFYALMAHLAGNG